ncbi:MAG: flagellar biosynthesis protein FlhB [Vicinamibacterales bacterium]
MGMFGGSEDKTEKPTGRRLQDARKKGQMARSVRAPRAASLAAALAVFSFSGGPMIDRLTTTMGETLARLGDKPLRTISDGELFRLLLENGALLGLIVGPLALAVALAVVAVQVAQGGWNFASEALQFDLNKLNPAAGISRLMGQGPVELVMMLVPAGIVAWIAWQQISGLIGGGVILARIPPMEAARAGWDVAHGLFVQVTVTLLVLAGADYALQKYRHIKSLKMTKQEVKDDNKMQDGNPLIKGRVRSLQRQIAMRRMLGDVARATVVVTNPTHFAVALEYDRQTMAAPRILAKGRDKLALRIKTLAREHGVPMVENRPLAQALYWGAEVGEFIPAPLFEAVAEVLAYLIRLKQLAL